MVSEASPAVKDRGLRIRDSPARQWSPWLAWLVVERRLRIDFLSDVPSYKQLADQLRAAITSGEIRPGEALPSLAQMVQETGLSMSTVQRAVRVLVGEGLVVTVPGRAIFAAPRD
jgi:hypothetical protein